MSDRNQKLEEIEMAIINRLHFFTRESDESSVSKNWSREGIVALSKALKDITTVKLMNQGAEEEMEDGVVEVASPFMMMPE